MSKTPPAPPSLADLRKEIDAIDEQMHRPADAARRHHRPADPGEEDPGGRLGIPARARSRHDAAAGRTPSRHPAARYGREHLARHRLDLHLRAGAVLGARRCFGQRIRDARFRAVSFRLHRALCGAFQRPGRGRSRGEIEGRSGAGVGDIRPTPWWITLEPAGAPKSSRGCLLSSAPIIRPHCRCSRSRASPTTLW